MSEDFGKKPEKFPVPPLWRIMAMNWTGTFFGGLALGEAGLALLHPEAAVPAAITGVAALVYKYNSVRAYQKAKHALERNLQLQILAVKADACAQNGIRAACIDVLGKEKGLEEYKKLHFPINSSKR